MTPQDHNKVIGIMHLIYGGFNALIMMILVPFFLAIAGMAAADPNAPGGITAIFGLFGALMLFLALLFGLPPLLAGYAMLKHKSWAKVMGIISAVMCSLSFPFGTALCVYTFWFLFGQNESYYQRGGQMAGQQGWNAPPLRDANMYDWDAQRNAQANRQREYVPPPQPPDWRGQ